MYTIFIIFYGWEGYLSALRQRQRRPLHRQTHNALNDAIAQAKIFKKQLEAVHQSPNK